MIAKVPDDINFLNYIITSKGRLLTAERVAFATGSRQTSIRFKPNFSHSPYCNVVVFYINKAGEMVTGSVGISVRDKLPNFVRFFLIIG